MFGFEPGWFPALFYEKGEIVDFGPPGQKKYAGLINGVYERKPPRKRQKRHRPKQPKQVSRESPSQRPGKRYKTILVPEETYVKLHEMGRLYQVSFGRIVAALVEPAFEEAYQDSLLLARIEETRQKEKELAEQQKPKSGRPRKTDQEPEAPDDSKPARRTHF
jgi:hypothetical protein